ncbi:hypothetical protein [Oceanobacillus sp. CAU 1775]
MIVPITGNVKYSITLDPTVWIFDDRKIKFEDAFNNPSENTVEEPNFSSASRYNKEVFQATNGNKPISKVDGKEILENSYVISLDTYLDRAEIKEDAVSATLVKTNGEEETISLKDLYHTYLLFAWKGKPLKEDGPVHVYMKDGSNKEAPIKFVTKIVIN